MAAEHQRDYHDLLVAHDQFHSTHSAENQRFTLRAVRSACAMRDTSPAARSARPTTSRRRCSCPIAMCAAPARSASSADQYGDSCEVCGATYTPAELIDPVSTVSGSTPVLARVRRTCSSSSATSRRCCASGWRRGAQQARCAPSSTNGSTAGLQDWDISRDAPYFGFEIPDAPGKYFYVWFDAPIGYIASFEALCAKRGPTSTSTGGPSSATELYHFIGKDISYFHNLFWPAVLHGAGLPPPTRRARARLSDRQRRRRCRSRAARSSPRAATWSCCRPKPLRYYFAAQADRGVEDIDLSLDDFVARVNSDLVGKFVNIASRCAGFIERGGGRLADALPDPELYAEFVARAASASPSSTTQRDYSARDPRDHGAGRSRQPVRRPPQALGARQGSGARPPRCGPSARRASTCSAC